MKPIISVENLYKSYKDKIAINNISFKVNEGEIFGILGPNGAGKTTTIELLEGLRKKDHGYLKVMGYCPFHNFRNIKKKIGVQLQKTSLPPKIKVKEVIQLFSSLYEKNNMYVFEYLNLNEKIDVVFEELSGGWKQRLTLAIALFHNPKIIFLDEPTTGLDPEAKRRIWDLLFEYRDKGSTIIITTHQMEEAEAFCDRVAIFLNGSIVDLNSPSYLLKKYENQNQYIEYVSEEFNTNILKKYDRNIIVEEKNNKYIVYSSNIQKTAYHIFRLSENKGWKIQSFKYNANTMEDTYLKAIDQEDI